MCVGSVPLTVRSALCCDVCNDVMTVTTHLKFESVVSGGAIQRKRRRVNRFSKELTDQLRSSLLRERDKYMYEHPRLKFLSENCVCPTCYVDSLCESAHCIQSEDDPRLSKLNSALKSIFFATIQNGFLATHRRNLVLCNFCNTLCMCI